MGKYWSHGADVSEMYNRGIHKYFAAWEREISNQITKF
jgi:hypothetical protein